MRLEIESVFKSAKLDNRQTKPVPYEWDEASRTVLLKYRHVSNTEVIVEVEWEIA